jgi:hypothetical protein
MGVITSFMVFELQVIMREDAYSGENKARLKQGSVERVRINEALLVW